MNGQDIILYILDEGERAIPEQIAKGLIESFPGGRDWINPTSVAIIADVLRVYGDARAATERERTARAASASTCEQCARGDVPTYHEDWMGWYHGETPCLGTSIRHAIQVAMP